jgi:RNA polymerase sigma factor (sigma-70 family)
VSSPVIACNAAGGFSQLHGVSLPIITPQNGDVRDGTSKTPFAAIYQAHVAAVTGFFARRGADPQTVADLVSETFAEAIGSFATFDPTRGRPRPWLYAIARAVYARHRERETRGEHVVERLIGRVVLSEDDIEDLAARIDAQRAGRALLERCARLPELERQAIELVDLDDFTPPRPRPAWGSPPAHCASGCFVPAPH